ncbi:MAG: hypothetical protein RR381_04455 [Raoultibacter sp.]
MVLFVILGVVLGILGFLPLFGSLQLAKRATTTSNLSHASALMLGVLVSFIVLAGALIICAVAARDMVLPFALGEIITLLVATITYGVYKLVRK